eukprot:SAG11_NODE_21966_length_415_cov_0.484177_1_plen_44_part_01
MPREDEDGQAPVVPATALRLKAGMRQSYQAGMAGGVCGALACVA